MAPDGCDALFILMPIAPNIEDTPRPPRNQEKEMTSRIIIN